MKFRGTNKNFLQGVSQEPDYVRLPEHLSLVQNCRSSATKGIGKRPGTEFITELGDTADFTDKVFWTYERGDREEAYTFVIGDGALRIFDLFTGTEQTVNATGVATYLTATNPKDAFRFCTFADTTFILNSEIEPAMGSASAAETWQRMIYCKQANYSQVYNVIIDGTTVATHTTGASGALSTDAVITALGAAGLSAWAGTNSVTYELAGDVIYLTKAGATYKIRTEDGHNSRDLFVVGTEVDEYETLAPIAKNGYKIKVTGLDSSKENDYYIQFETEDALSIGRGVWKESCGFGVTLAPTPASMPIQVIREETGEFTVSTITWTPRAAGDDDSNPVPSFIGQKVSDIKIYQNRLLLSTGEGVVGSVTNDFFNFFSPSVLRVAINDPVDSISSDNKVTNIHHMTVFNSALVLFSDSAQFMHQAGTPFTPTGFSLVPKAKYPSSPSAAPVSVGSSIFFPFTFGVYSGLREVQFDPFTGNLAIQPVTDHVTKYIKGTVRQIEASTGHRLLAVRAEHADSMNKLYIYEWYNQGEQQLQRAWSTWEFTRDILHIAELQNELWMLTEISGKVLIEKISLGDEDSLGVPFPVRLDMLQRVQGIPDYTNDVWDVPTDIKDYNTTVTIIAADSTGIAGLELVHSDDAVPEISGEYLLMLYEDNYVDRIYAEPGYVVEPTPFFWVGIPFTAEGIITNPYVKDQNDVIKDSAPLRLEYLEFSLQDTGSITLYCKTDDKTFEKVYNGRILDKIGVYPNDPPDIRDIKLRLGVRSDRSRCEIGFKSDEYTPFYVMQADWSGKYRDTGRRSR